MAPHVPHDGYLADFLMRNKGLIREWVRLREEGFRREPPNARNDRAYAIFCAPPLLGEMIC
jgi:hypothetical protein